jgi:3-deoxy-manno-octulosonate cytidylyltransferase (CMP-KDO synthetase)
MTDKTVIIIPARYASTRFEGKPLAMLTGSTGARKSLIQRSWETACDVPSVDGIFVATDDQRIADAVHNFGGQVIMTSQNCRNGQRGLRKPFRNCQSLRILWLICKGMRR